MNIVALTLMLISLVACHSDGRGDLKFGPKVSKLQPSLEVEKVTFVELKAEILGRCTGCHKDMVEETGVLPFVVKGNADESPFFQVLKDGSMPKKQAPLNTEELEFVRKYIENLAP